MREEEVFFSFDYEMFKKFKRMCELKNCSVNSGIVNLVQKCVSSFEEEHGEIGE